VRQQNVFILGMNDFTRAKLSALPEAEECAFHELLSLEESHGAAVYDVHALMDKARRRLDAFDGPIDAIVGFWDFPISIMQTLLSEEYGCRAPSPQSVLRCEQKLWSRRKQIEVIRDLTPRFRGFDVFAENPREQIDLEYPYWIKPVKSFAGHLGYRVENDADLDHALSRIRKQINRFAEPFKDLLSYTAPPEEFRGEETGFCIAEGIIGGQQCTVEGFVRDGELDLHGIIDSHRIDSTMCFSHFRYPSTLPEPVRRRMREATVRIMERVGFDNGAFNVEYFWNEELDDIKLLEINPRISQSHADLFHKVDGVPNHKITVDVALNRPPHLSGFEGKYSVAGKWFIRRFENGVVTRAPGEKELQRLKEVQPDTVVDLAAEEGQELEDLDYQDSYSYKLAFVYLGGDSDEEMREKFDQACEILGYRVEPVEGAEEAER
jgi:hypothetical protein